MGQKVNPISLRLQKTNREFDNSWYTDHFYKKLVSRDIYLQQYINSFLKLVKFPSARFSIQYSVKNVKLYTFLCYPIQSRIMRSKMFGINLRGLRGLRSLQKKRQENFNTLSFFKKKDEKKTKTEKIKIQKFLLNNHLWTRIYSPFFRKEKKQIKNLQVNFIKNQKVQLNIFDQSKIYDTIVFSKSKLLIFPCFFVFDFQSKKQNILFFSKNKKRSVSEKSTKYFIKNFLITLYFIQFLHKTSSNLNTNSSTACLTHESFGSFNREYKKNCLKFFLVFYLLYNQYNKNVVLKKKEKFFNQFSSFSFFQPNSIFYTILENRTPIDLLKNPFLQSPRLEQNSLNIRTPLNTLSTSSNRNEKASVFGILGEKNKKILGQLKHKNYIHHFLSSQFQMNTDYVPFGISHDWQSAGFLADEIVYFLERRVPFRRLKNKLLKKIAENVNIRGIRISCSGRVGGKSKKAQRAKMECVKYGQTSRHTFSSRIDFAARTARTIFGSVGIKVWICYQ